MLKRKQNYHDQSNRVRYVIKTRQDNDLIDHTGMVYVEKETELSWSMALGTVCDENLIGQRRDRSYTSGLCQKQNWTIVID